MTGHLLHPGDPHARADDERYRAACGMATPDDAQRAELAWLESRPEPRTAIERGRLAWLRATARGPTLLATAE